LTYRDLPEAVAGVGQINADYTAHCRAARALAETVFSTEKVLPPFLAAAMN
jgi:hypothetical protein